MISKQLIYVITISVILLIGIILLSVGAKTINDADGMAIDSAIGTIIDDSCREYIYYLTVKYTYNGLEKTRENLAYISSNKNENLVGRTFRQPFLVGTNGILDAYVNLNSQSASNSVDVTVIDQKVLPRNDCSYTVQFNYNGKQYTRVSKVTNSGTYSHMYSAGRLINVYFYKNNVENSPIAINFYENGKYSDAYGGDVGIIETSAQYNLLKKTGTDLTIAGGIFVGLSGFILILLGLKVLKSKIWENNNVSPFIPDINPQPIPDINPQPIPDINPQPIPDINPQPAPTPTPLRPNTLPPLNRNRLNEYR